MHLKLPRQFLIELSWKTHTNYSNFNQLIENYQSILIRLRLGLVEQGIKPKVKIEPSPSNTKWDSKPNPVNDNKSRDSSNLNKGKSSFDFNKKQTFKCKFCSSLEHSSAKCHSFNTFESRKARVPSLGMCGRGLNKKHNTSVCPGLKAALPYKCFTCGKADHHGALCPKGKELGKPKKTNFSINNGSDIIVPIISLPVSRGKKSARCHFLLDTGAQFSIINKEFVEKNVGVCLSPPSSRSVSSLGMLSAHREGFNYTADLTLPCSTKTYCIFFAMEGFCLPVQIPN